jgi:hypothetical protein
MRKRVFVLALALVFLLVFSVEIVEAAECSDTPAHTSGYSLNYLGRHLSCEGYPARGWTHIIEEDVVVNTSAPAVNYISLDWNDVPTGRPYNITINYSTSDGSWLPTNTYTNNLRLNVNGNNKIHCARGPIPMLKAVYRVWGSTAVNIRSHTKVETAIGASLDEVIDRLDTFQRQDATTILVNETPRVVASEAFFDVESVNIRLVDNGFANSHLRITNDLCGNYFDVELWVEEQDEQYDHSRVWMESYIEAAEPGVCGDGAIDTGENCTSCPEDLGDECGPLDKDNDGYDEDVDCDDNNASINPGAEEACDGVDTNCDGNIDEGLKSFIWKNMNGDEIRGSDLDDTVQMVATCFAGEADEFSIYERDTISGDDDIRVGTDAIMGEVIGNDVIGLWTITQSDLDKTSDYRDFEFVIGGQESVSLDIDPNRNDEPLEIKIRNPICNTSFDVGTAQEIVIEFYDGDDMITGNVSIGGVLLEEVSNGVFSRNYTFLDYGSLQILAYGENDKGFAKRAISNIMVINPALMKKYVAACIETPEDYSEIEDNPQWFSAATSRGLDFTSGSEVEIPLEELTFAWTFKDSGARPVVLGSEPNSYQFWKIFSGSEDRANWATLSVGVSD